MKNIKNIKNIMNAIKSDFITEDGFIHMKDHQILHSKNALQILVAELDRLHSLEFQINEKKILSSHAIELARKEEGRWCSVRLTEETSKGIVVVLWEDFHDFSQGTNTYEYTWKELKKSYHSN